VRFKQQEEEGDGRTEGEGLNPFVKAWYEAGFVRSYNLVTYSWTCMPPCLPALVSPIQ